MSEQLRRVVIGLGALGLLIPLVVAANQGFPPDGCSASSGPLAGAWANVIAATSLWIFAIARRPYRPLLLMPAVGVAVLSVWLAASAASACRPV